VTGVDRVESPAAVVDLERLDRNLRGWQEHCDRVGLANRPHVKTHKCVAIAMRQVVSVRRGSSARSWARPR